jgi:hypothetical protein
MAAIEEAEDWAMGAKVDERCWVPKGVGNRRMVNRSLGRVRVEAAVRAAFCAGLEATQGPRVTCPPKLEG